MCCICSNTALEVHAVCRVRGQRDAPRVPVAASVDRHEWREGDASSDVRSELIADAAADHHCLLRGWVLEHVMNNMTIQN
jgi:hypothetical protein